LQCDIDAYLKVVQFYNASVSRKIEFKPVPDVNTAITSLETARQLAIVIG
jgi:hypothetical protein